MMSRRGGNGWAVSNAVDDRIGDCTARTRIHSHPVADALAPGQAWAWQKVQGSVWLVHVPTVAIVMGPSVELRD